MYSEFTPEIRHNNTPASIEMNTSDSFTGSLASSLGKIVAGPACAKTVMENDGEISENRTEKSDCTLLYKKQGVINMADI